MRAEFGGAFLFLEREREEEREGAAGTRSQITCLRVIKKEELWLGQVYELHLKMMPYT